MMQLVRVCFLLVRNDIVSAYRHKADWVNAWLFFVLIVMLFPLAVVPEASLLHAIAPALIWVAAFLAMLLSLQHFLRPDYGDGSLDLLLLSPYPLPLLLLAKMLAHWCISALPLIIITPLLALILQLSWLETGALLSTLLLGTPVFSLIGGITMALTVGLRNQSMLLALLVLPLCIPILIFGAGAVMNVMYLPLLGVFALLGALLLLALTFAPLAASVALKIGLAQGD